MDPIDNPYRPGAGIRPSTLAGRDSELQEARILIQALARSNIQRSFLYYGLRGVGKTVLLNEIAAVAESEAISHDHIEISESDDFRVVIAETLRSLLLSLDKIAAAKNVANKALGILKAFSVTIEDVEFRLDVDAITGKADSGNFQKDLTDLFDALGEVAAKAEKPIVLFIDELQYLKERDFEALLAANHRVFQKRYPLIVIGAGLPQILKLAGEAKSYSERLYDFKPLGHLTRADAARAMTGPGADVLTFSRDSLREIYRITDGYPYFLQELGSVIWSRTSNGKVTPRIVRDAAPTLNARLDASFFKVRYDRSTNSEKKFMHAMAELGSDVCDIGKIADSLDKSTTSVGPTRAQLISKGFIYAPDYGKLAFTVPQFGKFLERQPLAVTRKKSSKSKRKTKKKSKASKKSERRR